MARTYYLGRVFSEQIDKTWWSWNVFVASLIECNVAIVCACAPSVKALFGRHFRDAALRYGGGSTVKPSTKGSYGTGSVASESGHQFGPGQSGRDTELQVRPKVKVNSAHAKVDSAYAVADRPAHVVHTMRTHEDTHGDEEVPVAYTGTSRIPASHIASQSISLAPFTQPAPRSGDPIHAPFLLTSSPSTTSDDEVGLVSETRYDGRRRDTVDKTSIARPAAFHFPPDSDARSLTAGSPSPTALSHQDAAIPASMLSPDIRNKLELARMERTKYSSH